ncbi:MAG: hypothetical protein JXR68_08930 [Bacteroidales bacterium]|nr:hypothetical protein [Bacteroidales bacterium]
MLNKDSKYEWRQSIFRAIKPFFNEKIGRLTHQKISEDWHFRGLAFVRDDMTYVFGFNVGFFKKGPENSDYDYDFVGMNVLVRTNGVNTSLRNKYKDFFQFHLEKWLLHSELEYTSFRGGIGIELPRILKLESFKSDEEIIDFLKDSIGRLAEIWPYIASNPENVFSHVVRGNPPWDETIIELALKKASNIYKP